MKDRAPKEILARLGTEGLTRTLDDLLDQTQLVRLANTCGLEYRGMRTQTQTRERLLSDLVKKSTATATARKAILHALRKETTAGSREWERLSAAEKADRLCDEKLMRSKGNLGLHLYLLAASGDTAELDGVGHVLARQQLVGIATNGNGSALATSGDARERTRLKRTVTELEKKVRHLDGQLSKSRESQKSFKRDLIERKGELAESRMLVERLRRELATAQTAAQVASEKKPVSAPADKTVTTLARTVRELASQQKKLIHALEKGIRPETKATEGRALAALMDDVRGVRKELASQQRASTDKLSAHTRRIEELRSEVRSQVAALGATAKTAKRARAKAEGQRVGVFIDVQNMYYAARQLKGKLDFDALLSAAVTRRRLIQATAYVVESKDNDQSQFIEMLQKRAIKVQRKTLKVRADGSMKGDWDMELALDILDAAPSLDVVVLVSGDGDFTSLVKRVKAMGPRVEVIAFPRATAKALVEAADRFQPLDRKFMIYPKRRKPEPPPKDVKPTAAEDPARD
jgi:uncharacterized LabA/DUF88 family protein